MVASLPIGRVGNVGRVGRVGKCAAFLPTIPTIPANPTRPSQTETVELIEHVGDAAADRLALHPQRGDLGEARLRIGNPGAGRLELARQPRVSSPRARDRP